LGFVGWGDGAGAGLLVEHAAAANPTARVAREIAARFIISWM
jgi:hypothetical protein